MVIKRLDAQAVAGDEEAPAARVPDCEGKHTTQVLHAIWSVLFVQVNDRLGVAVGAVVVTLSLQFFAQGGMVVDFTVENNPHGSVFVA